MRRAASMLRPYRREVIARRCVLIVRVDARHPGRAVPREVRHRPGHHRRATARRSNRGRRRLRRRGHRCPTSSTARSSSCSSQAGEGFLRDLRVKVFDHLQALSMPFYDRSKAGVLVSRMTSDVDSHRRAGADRPAHVPDEHAAAGVLGRGAGAGVVAAAAAVPGRAAVRRARQHQVPARLQPGLPRRCATASAARCRAAGGHRRRAGHPGLRARGPSRSTASSATTARSTTPTCSRCSCRPGTCR